MTIVCGRMCGHEEVVHSETLDFSRFLGFPPSGSNPVSPTIFEIPLTPFNQRVSGFFMPFYTAQNTLNLAHFSTFSHKIRGLLGTAFLSFSYTWQVFHHFPLASEVN